ncbi:VOC family protein [Nocardiopsis sp. HNM0947]|uniref:VOC family protein n=1 Tax=Nocardiopsis coralli TaxID=2772213 RepID=A0ABR9PA65_9ACTN|nr:VOC family protein [Nocardiopsis coralli]MBE3000724.1 VOC family protein [Nocardiopsis coralli]
MAVDIHTPNVIPYLLYDDPARIRDFLSEALGFTEVATHRSPDGEVGNIQLRMADQFVMLSRAQPSMGMAGPGALPAVHAGVMVYVDDVDAHFEHARSAGATIWYEPQDMPYGQREYGVRDPENGFWCFGTLLPEPDPS